MGDEIFIKDIVVLLNNGGARLSLRSVGISPLRLMPPLNIREKR